MISIVVYMEKKQECLKNLYVYLSNARNVESIV